MLQGVKYTVFRYVCIGYVQGSTIGAIDNQGLPLAANVTYKRLE